MDKILIFTITTLIAQSISSLSYADCSGRPLNDSPITDMVGATANPTGEPIGGGFGYSSTWSAADADYVVNSDEELIDVLENHASSGDVIFLEPEGDFSMNGELDVLIPGGVTLTSSRGAGDQLGAEIYKTDYPPEQECIDDLPCSMFLAAGEGVRLSGLRLRGPEDRRLEKDEKPSLKAIVSRFDGLEVDNCELSNWVSAVSLESSVDHHVHHNYIHQNWRKARGYGVVVGHGADTVIEANLFDYNRHAIAGDGKEGSSYEARFNVVGWTQYSHSFDMHGEADNGSPWAGDRIYIHHNTFLDDDQISIKIRDVPETCAWIDYNEFVHPTESEAIVQINDEGNISTTGNEFGYQARAYDYGAGMRFRTSDYRSTPMSGDFNRDGFDDIAYYGRCGSNNRDCWRVHLNDSEGEFDAEEFGAGMWFYNSTVQSTPMAGDFNADGYSDIAYYGKCGSNARKCWRVHLNDQDEGFRTVEFGAGMWFRGTSAIHKPMAGDFNADGYSDIAYYGKCGSNSRDCWRVHLNDQDEGFKTVGFGAGMWFRDSGIRSTPMAGDFNGDGYDDIAYFGRCGGDGHYCWRIHINDGDNGFDVIDAGADMRFRTTDVASTPMSADLNRDGFADIIYYGSCGSDGRECWRLHLNTQDNDFETLNYGAGMEFEGTDIINTPMAGDFDGDHIDGIVYFGRCGNDSHGCWRVHQL